MTTQALQTVRVSLQGSSCHLSAPSAPWLIANAIIYYNTALISKVYAQKLAAADEAAIEILRVISPVAWQHVNLFGSFEFTDATTKVNIDALAEPYADPGFWSRVLRETHEEPLG